MSIRIRKPPRKYSIFETGTAASFLGTGGLACGGGAIAMLGKLNTVIRGIDAAVFVVNHPEKAGWMDYLSIGLGAIAAKGLLKCFTEDTQVVIGENSDGVFSTKRIADIKVGDEVLTRNQNNPDAPLEMKKVTNVIRHTVTELEDVVIRSADGSTQTIQTTAEHPFYVDGRGWTGSSHLLAGDELIEDDGQHAIVVSVSAEAHPEGVDVFNFEVEGDHTYFVESAGSLSGDDAVWVHNMCRGQHHFDPYSWGNNIPYKNNSLPMFTKWEHTIVHRKFSDFLEKKTGFRFRSLKTQSWVNDIGMIKMRQLTAQFYREFSAKSLGRLIASRVAKRQGWSSTISLYDMYKAQHNYAKFYGYLKDLK